MLVGKFCSIWMPLALTDNLFFKLEPCEPLLACHEAVVANVYDIFEDCSTFIKKTLDTPLGSYVPSFDHA